MNYATIPEVKSLFRDFADNSEAAVNDTEIQLFLDNATAIINAGIGTLYQMPITQVDNPESFKILRQLEMYKVACVIDSILNDYPEADKKPMWCQKFEMLMNALVPPKSKGCKQCEPTIKLPDAIYIGTSRQTNRISAQAQSGTVFKKNERNW